MSAVEIHRELSTVYGQNAMSEGTVGQWCRVFKDGRANVHDEERSGRPSVLSDDLVQGADQNICERHHFTISELSCKFPQISHTVLYEIITVGLGYHKF
jgi:transposase